MAGLERVSCSVPAIVCVYRNRYCYWWRLPVLASGVLVPRGWLQRAGWLGGDGCALVA